MSEVNTLNLGCAHFGITVFSDKVSVSAKPVIPYPTAAKSFITDTTGKLKVTASASPSMFHFKFVIYGNLLR